MKKKSLFVIALLIMLACSGCGTDSAPTPADNNTTTKETSKKTGTQAEKVSEKLITYTDRFGYPNILYLATVKNTDTVPLEFGNVTIDVKDSEQNLIKHLDMGAVKPQFIMPGEYGYICENVAQFDENIDLSKVSSAEMHFGTRMANYERPDVEVTQLTLKDTGHSWSVLGKVKANADYTGLSIAIPVKDSSGELQTVCIGNIDQISAGSERGFECTLLDYDPDANFSASTLEAIPYIWNF